ncbi:MAG TPA: hypothetical protein VKT75_05815, partial [Acidobacteriaceae bacterium]|nr:hypothetical protein [Acidobacteriaceae bacterium]
DSGQVRGGVQRDAEAEVQATLYRRQDDRLIWIDRASGGTIALTEYVRHMARIRSDVQCVLDAARTAYAYLRSSFDEYCRKFER